MRGGHRSGASNIQSKAVVVTSGTFLNGVIHIGEKRFGGGRVAEKAATGITEQLVSLGFESDRLKTGTPPRIDGRSLDYFKMEEQRGMNRSSAFPTWTSRNQPNKEAAGLRIPVQPFMIFSKPVSIEAPCIQAGLKECGPRYCPSIEDKINRFAERERHQLFIEPEGWNTVEIYVNGFSPHFRKRCNMRRSGMFRDLKRSGSSAPDTLLNMIFFHLPS